VATILERSAQSILQDWFQQVQREKSLIPLSYELRGEAGIEPTTPGLEDVPLRYAP
jgi:hypothetical protein